MNIHHLTVEELEAMRDACDEGSEDWQILDGIASTRKADEYAHQVDSGSGSDSSD